MIRHLTFYFDGSYSSKTEMSGWSAICLEDDIIIDTQIGFEPLSTNNRAELLGFLSVLENIDTIETSRVTIDIFTNSFYISDSFNRKWYRKWLTNGWKTADKQKIKNQDLLTRIVALYIKLSNKFNINIIKADDNLQWCKYVNLLAVEKRQEMEKRL